MLRIERRVLTLAEAVASVVSGDVVPSVYDIEASGDARGPGLSYRLRKKQRSSPLGVSALPTASINVCSTKPAKVTPAEWIEQNLANRGVVACVPQRAPVALSREVACGQADYWVRNFMDNVEIFNAAKTRRAGGRNRLIFEANLLTSGVPPFFPEGDAFGLKPAETDEFFDAGVSVTIRRAPYESTDEPVSFKDSSKRAALCATELAYTLEMVQRGLTPCVVAAFLLHSSSQEPAHRGSKPLAYAPPPAPAAGAVSALVLINQISTFSLDDLMYAITRAPVKSKRDHLVGVLEQVCAPVFEVLRKLTTLHEGRATVKLNLTPESVVFAPKLVADSQSWQLEGVGYMPVSEMHLDGVPKLVDFNGVFTTRVRGESHSPETAFVLHCLLILAYTRAAHGPFVSSVLWNHLIAEGDPSGFLKAAREVQSKKTNAGAFLAALAANAEMRETPELAKALAELVSDMDEVVRKGVVAADGSLSMPVERAMFSKLVSIVTKAAQADTRLFELADEPDESERAHLEALEAVKALAM